MRKPSINITLTCGLVFSLFFSPALFAKSKTTREKMSIMKLYLVQHADAKSKEQDPARPLSDRGRQDLEKMQKVLRPLELTASAIWHSDKLRAIETAKLLAPVFSATDKLKQRDDLAWDASVEKMKKHLAAHAGDLMLVGHLPFMTKLAHLLLTGKSGDSVVKFQKGGVVCLGRDGAGVWHVEWMMVPKIAGK